MNHRKLLVIFSLVLSVVGMLGLHGCKERRNPERPPDAAKPQVEWTNSTVSRSAVLDDQPVSATIICNVKSDTGGCPVPVGNDPKNVPYWHVTHLGSVRDAADGSIMLPNEVWCSYAYVQYLSTPALLTGASQPDPADEVKSKLTAFIETATPNFSCRVDNTVVVPLQGDYPIDNSTPEKYLVTTFAQQAGVHSKCPWNNEEVFEAKSPVVIAIPDSSPMSSNTTKATLGATTQHGTVLAALMREYGGQVTGPTGDSCAAEILTTLALDKVLLNAPRGVLATSKFGGNIGDQSSLAAAIQQALEVWTESHSEKKLIINLSVGWEQLQDVEYPTVVRDVLWNAVAKGALVIAAAGNRASKNGGTGLMYPAAYAHEGYMCDEGGTCPLVIPVGGVDRKGFSLMANRPMGIPHLLAPAQMAVGDAGYVDWGANPQKNLTSLTGTSVAAAVASATAARVWAKNPTMAPHEVMKQVWNFARKPSGTAAIWPKVTSLSPSVCHQAPYAACSPETVPLVISMCHADQSVVASQPCYTDESNVPWPAPSGLPADKAATVTTVANVAPTACGSGYTFFNQTGTGSAEKICPEISKGSPPSVAGGITPQPGGCGCDDCRLVHQTGDLYTLYYYIRGDCAGTLEDPRLVMSDIDPPTGTVSIELGIDPLPQGSQRTVTDISIPNYSNYQQASIVVTIDNGTYAFEWQIVN